MSYSDVWNSLDLDANLTRLASSGLAVPEFTLKVPFDDYGFPPALIPLCNEHSNPVYLGLWKHWFSDRELSYGYLNLEQGYPFVETARTAEQFKLALYLLVYGMSEWSDDDDVAQANKFGQSLGLDVGMMARAAEVYSTTGVISSYDALPHLPGVAPFDTRLPLRAVNASEYEGDFPNDQMELKEATLARVCGLELTEGLYRRIAELDAPPLWLTSTDKPTAFDLYLEVGDFSAAWMTLNSPGWTIAAIQKALSALAEAANDTAFSVFADAYLGVKTTTFSGY